LHAPGVPSQRSPRLLVIQCHARSRFSRCICRAIVRWRPLRLPNSMLGGDRRPRPSQPRVCIHEREGAGRTKRP
jgi:hypothetical protein